LSSTSASEAAAEAAAEDDMDCRSRISVTELTVLMDCAARVGLDRFGETPFLD
jgi:predicted DsbA family dithiol-disulfide isomerase